MSRAFQPGDRVRSTREIPEDIEGRIMAVHRADRFMERRATILQDDGRERTIAVRFLRRLVGSGSND